MLIRGILANTWLSAFFIFELDHPKTRISYFMRILSYGGIALLLVVIDNKVARWSQAKV